MKQCWILLTGLTILFGIGCSGPTVPPPEEQYATNIKRLVLEFTQRVKTNPKVIGTDIDGILEALENHEEQSGSKHTDVYPKLLAAAKEIQNARKSGNLSTVPAKLKEMTDLANKLPGDVKIDVKETGGDLNS